MSFAIKSDMPDYYFPFFFAFCVFKYYRASVAVGRPSVSRSSSFIAVLACSGLRSFFIPEQIFHFRADGFFSVPQSLAAAIVYISS